MTIGADQRAQSLSDGSNRPGHDLTLRELRQLRELSIRHVEAVTGINRARLSMIERGLEYPSNTVLRRLSKLYGVNPDAWQVVVEHWIPGAAT